MSRITAPPLPDDSLLARHRGPECYRDAFRVEVPGDVSLAELITVFFGSGAFLPERTALRLIGRGAGRAEIAELADGRAKRFAAWELEAREENELLMHDFLDKTCCWLAVSPGGEAPDLAGGLPRPGAGRTYLWFGTGVRDFEGPIISRLREAHRWYARWLLAGAARRLG